MKEKNVQMLRMGLAKKVLIKGAVLNRLVDVFRRHPEPNLQRINRLSKELRLSNLKLLSWFKKQRGIELANRKKVQSVLFHVLLHDYVCRVEPNAAKLIFNSFKVLVKFLSLMY